MGEFPPAPEGVGGPIVAKTKTHPKSTNVEVEDRVNDVFSMLLVGAGRARIIQYAAEKWKVGTRQCDRYIEKANQQFRETNSHDRGLAFGKAAERLEHLYSRAMKSGDSRQALWVEKEIIGLYGLRDVEIEELCRRVELLEKLRLRL
jgi:hypothetical protein